MTHRKLQTALTIVTALGWCPTLALAQGMTPPHWWVDQNSCTNPPDPQATLGSYFRPFCKIQEAINDPGVQSGHIVRVIGWDAQETVVPYVGEGNKNIAMNNGKAIHLTCMTSIPGKCVIDCEGSGRGFNLTSGTSSGAVIEGFTIRNCNGIPTPPLPNDDRNGGGIRIHQCSPTIRGNVIENCTASARVGGGLYCFASGALIEGNLIQNNHALGSGTGLGGGIYVKGEGGNPILRGNNVIANSANAGGGIYTEHNATIVNCTIENNVATVTAGGGLHLSGKGDAVRDCRILRNTAVSNGAGVFLPNGTVTIEGCLIGGNVSAAYGGGFGCKDDGNAVILHSIIANNTSRYLGGGIYLYASGTSSITNSLIVRNRSTEERGGGIGVEAGLDVSLRNCVVADNSAPSNVPGGGAYFSSNTALVANSIFWGNQSGDGTQIGIAGTEVTIRYSDVQDRFVTGVSANNMNTVHFGDGCIGEDTQAHAPLFVDTDGPDNDPNTWDDNDYRVTLGDAPGNDAGNNDDIALDVNDLDHDGNTGERVPFDLKGTIRRADDPISTASGAPANDFPWVDFGAYEQCGVVTPVAGGGAPNYRNRAIPLSLNDSAEFAIRVRLVSLQHPDPANPPASPPPTFTAFEGQSRWVGEPAKFNESPDNPGLGHVRIARLQCTPYYRNWSQVGEDNLGSEDPADDQFFVVGAEIVPSSTYRVETYLKSSCEGAEDTCAEISCAVEFTTARWGDIIAPFNPPDISTQPDSLDIVAIVDKFRNQPNSLSGSVAHLQPNLPMFVQGVGALDIVATIDAFRGLAYPFSGPCACPSDVTCLATACDSAGACGGGLCVRTCVGGPNADDWCKDNSHCPQSTCGAGYCRDRCGRCN